MLRSFNAHNIISLISSKQINAGANSSSRRGPSAERNTNVQTSTHSSVQSNAKPKPNIVSSMLVNTAGPNCLVNQPHESKSHTNDKAEYKQGDLDSNRLDSAAESSRR